MLLSDQVQPVYAELIKHFILYRFFNFVTEILVNNFGGMLVRTTVKITAAASGAALPLAKISPKPVCSSPAVQTCRVFRSIGILGAYGVEKGVQGHDSDTLRFKICCSERASGTALPHSS